MSTSQKIGVSALGVLLLLCGLAFWTATHRTATRSTDPVGVKKSVTFPKDAKASLDISSASPIRLRDVSANTNVTFQHTDGSSGRRYIVEAMSAGLALFDYDGDGWIDVYLPNGAPLPGMSAEVAPRDALYRNVGGFQFEEVSDSTGLFCTDYGLGIGVGDYDNDGFADFFLNHFGANALYHNNGDGTFENVTTQAGVGEEQFVGAGACFLDADRDGDLDLYVGNYIDLDCDAHVPHESHGFPSYPSPTEYAPVPDTLLRNEGDGTFTDISRISGIGESRGRSMGMVCADYDNDGDTDIFVCNDVQENFFFRNDGHARFEQVALPLGAALNGDGQMLANMAVDCGDFDNDGWLDFFTTNYQSELPMLLQNVTGQFLEDVFTRTNSGTAFFPQVNWGCGFVDFDNDGHRDAFVANGHTEDNIELRDPSTSYRSKNVVLHNDGQGRLIQVPALLDEGNSQVHASRGAAFADLDNDGDQDVVVMNSREAPTFLRNELGRPDASHQWLHVRLRGTAVNRDGVGAHVVAVAGSWRQAAEIHSGRGYQSHWGTRLHFGLGPISQLDQLEVHWPTGHVDVFKGIAADQSLLILEDPEGTATIHEMIERE